MSPLPDLACICCLFTPFFSLSLLLSLASASVLQYVSSHFALNVSTYTKAIKESGGTQVPFVEKGVCLFVQRVLFTPRPEVLTST